MVTRCRSAGPSSGSFSRRYSCSPTLWYRLTDWLTSSGTMRRPTMQPAPLPNTCTDYGQRSVRPMPQFFATRPPGYRLSVEADQLDSARFTALVGNAQQLIGGAAERAKAIFDDALRLWSGPAWDEFADMDFVRAEVTRLDSLRTMALEDRADAMLTLGRTRS